MSIIKKAYAISDAKIQFVSLVGKAANKRKFVIAKSETEPDKAQFTSEGRIIKADEASHYVTGVVYEPMTADTDNNYMTEGEIIKAAHWFMKNAGNVDLQHDFTKLEGASVVESWITKADCEIEGQPIKKGTWMMTVEVTDNEVWEKVQKGDVTGFSMGGVGTYSETDDDISEPVSKSDGNQKVGILKAFADFLGLGTVMKGVVREQYETQTKINNFWTAFDVLKTSLGKYSSIDDKFVLDDDEESIREKLADFNEIITELLTSNNIKETLEKSAIKKAKKEENDMTKEDVKKIVDESVAKAMKQSNDKAAEQIKKEEQPTEITEEVIKKMVADAMAAAAVQKSEKEDTLTVEAVQEMVTKAVNEAMAPVLKSTGIPSNLNDDGEGVQKSEGHYMDDIFR